jgi:hypothetical protein
LDDYLVQTASAGLQFNKEILYLCSKKKREKRSCIRYVLLALMLWPSPELLYKKLHFPLPRRKENKAKGRKQH